MYKKVYEQIIGLLYAIDNCKVQNNDKWQEKHENNLELIEKNILPDGSGIDSGCTINREKSNKQKLVIDSAFHLMNNQGFYDGWIKFQVIVKPCLLFGFDINIKGQFSRRPKYSDLKIYLNELFGDCLNMLIDFENGKVKKLHKVCLDNLEKQIQAVLMSNIPLAENESLFYLLSIIKNELTKNAQITLER